MRVGALGQTKSCSCTADSVGTGFTAICNSSVAPSQSPLEGVTEYFTTAGECFPVKIKRSAITAAAPAFVREPCPATVLSASVLYHRYKFSSPLSPAFIFFLISLHHFTII